MHRSALRATVAVATAFLYLNSAPSQAQSCTTEVLGSDGNPIQSTYVGHRQNTEADFGPLRIVVDPSSSAIGGDGLVAGKIAQGLNQALASLRGACPGTTFNFMPNFAAALGEVGAPNPGFVENVTTLRLKYRRADSPWSGRHGGLTLAEWSKAANSDTNVIELAGKCPAGVADFPDICVGNDPNKDIDWSKAIAVNILIHEILHAMGLDHDRQSGDCASRNGLMRANPGANQTFEQEYCQMVNFKSCDPTVAGTTCPGDPRPRPPGPGGSNPTDRLSELCQRMPEFCEEGEPWWEGGGGAGSDSHIVCAWVTAGGETWADCRFELTGIVPTGTIQPGRFQGPSLTVSTPSPGAVVTGTLSLAGTAVRDGVGVQRVAAWVDDQPVTVALSSLPNAGACAGRTDPRCPWVGFQGSIDVRNLADGTHRLTLVASEQRPTQPTPGIVDVEFQVDNRTCTARPSTAVSSPIAGQVVAGTTLVSAAASDNRGVTRVELLIDGVLRLVDTTAPYGFSWNTTTYSDGLHTLETRAFDACDNRTRSAVVTVEVRNTVPRPSLRVLQAWDATPVPKGGSFQFPSVAVGASDSRRFALVNEGSAPLNLPHPAGLVAGTCFSQVTTATELPVSPVPAGQTTYFRVKFQCPSVGTFSGAVSIASDDPDDNPFTFQLTGTATAVTSPEIAVSQAWDGASIASGATQPFPSPAVNLAVSRRYAISNLGTAPLVIANPTSLVSGACFSQALGSSVDIPVSPVLPGQTTYFRVRLQCPTVGFQTGLVTINNDDADEGAFSIRLEGTVVP